MLVFIIPILATHRSFPTFYFDEIPPITIKADKKANYYCFTDARSISGYFPFWNYDRVILTEIFICEIVIIWFFLYFGNHILKICKGGIYANVHFVYQTLDWSLLRIKTASVKDVHGWNK